MPRKIDLVQLFVLHAGLIELLPLRDRYQMLSRGYDQFFDMDKETSMFLTKVDLSTSDFSFNYPHF